MASRRLPLLLAPLVLLGLMAAALLLALDGESPVALVPGDGASRAPAVDGGDAGPGDAGPGAPETGRRSRRAAHISGELRVLRTRAPAAGRTVTLTLADGAIRETTTGSDGAFAFGDVPPDAPHTVRIDGDDHAPVVRPGLFLRPGERLDLGTLWLADGVRVAVEVRSFDGQPLGGATVRAFANGSGAPAFGEPRDPTPVAVVNAPADGIARFPGLPPGVWTFTADRGGYARRGLVGVTVREGVAEERFQLALERGHRLDGRVVDGTGQPVAGAPVLAIRRTLVSDETTAPLALRTMSDRDGRFVFGALPAADIVLWSGWPRGRLAVIAAVRVPGVDDLDIVLTRGARLSGVVTRDTDGAPVTDATVRVALRVLGSFQIALEAHTDAEGRYELDLPMPGSVTSVDAEKEGHRLLDRADGGEEIEAPSGSTVTVDLEMEEAGVVRGRVMGPDGPLAAAEVTATNSGWAYSTMSDRAGRFVLNGLKRDTFFVMASLPGHTMADLPDDPDNALARGEAPARYVVDLAAAREAEVDIELQAGATLLGTVLTHDGAPAARALVTAGGSRGTHTAEDGTFALGPLSPGRTTLLAVAADGGARGTAVVEVPPHPDAPAPVTVRLGPALRVTGRLTSSTGAALEGAYVQIVPWDRALEHPVADEWSWLEETRLPVRADGTFDHPVDGTIGELVVRAGALGHRRARSGPVVVDEGRPAAYVEIELTPGATFTGRVLDLDGNAVSGAYVAMVAVPPGTDADGVDYPGAWGPPISAVADEHGVFRIGSLDAGLHSVRAWAEGYLRDARVVEVPQDSGVTLQIAAAMTIDGRVTFTDGQPVAGARVAAMHDDGKGYAYARTDDDGRFHVSGLASGPYSIEVSPTAQTGGGMVGTTVRGVLAGSAGVGVEVERGRSVEGRVVDTAGNVVDGAIVEAYAGEDFAGQVASDPDGSFSIGGLRDGTVRLVAQGGPMAGTGSVVVEVRAGATGVEIRMPAPDTIRGVVVDASGSPVASHQLQLHPIPVPGRAIEGTWSQTTTGADGSFTIDVAPGAEFRVVLAEHPELTLDADTRLTAGARDVRLVAGEGVRIVGRVVDPDGKGLGGIEVRASGADNVSRRTTSDANGAFSLSGLLAGDRYQIWPVVSGWSTPQIPTVEAPAADALLRLVPLLRAGGRVRDTGGAPLAEVTVHLSGKDGGTWSTWTDDEGAFRFDELPPGRYAVSVDRFGNGQTVECGSLEAGTLDADVRVPSR